MTPLRTGTGMVLGKFMPPHLGHVYLVDFARTYCRDLTVLVCSLAAEPIPGSLRAAWMRELFPDVRVVHVTDENPQEPAEHPEFWDLWLKTCRRALPEGPDFVFASEDYGFRLAEVLGATYVPVDHARSLIPVSGSEVRRDPLGNWRYLPVNVRAHYVRRVCVFGPESTGKSTLARRLAERYGTVWAAEYARPLLDFKGGRCDPEDIERIARGQVASEDALARQADRVLFCDTDLVTTMVWSEVLFGSCPEWVRAEAARRRYDLTLLTDVDVPFVPDAQRYLPNERAAFFERCRRELEARGRPYAVVRGGWDERFAVACRAVDELLAGGGPSRGPDGSS